MEERPPRRLGYADSVQISHRPDSRDQMNTAENWGYFSPQAELRLQNMMGLQTWNSIRSIDFLLGLEDTDPNRIGVTGASGGGTQSMIIAAIGVVGQVEGNFGMLEPALELHH